MPDPTERLTLAEARAAFIRATCEFERGLWNHSVDTLGWIDALITLIQAARVETAPPVSREVADDPAISAYYNAQTCICGEDATKHTMPGCEGFDPDWEALRRRENLTQAVPCSVGANNDVLPAILFGAPPAPEEGEAVDRYVDVRAFAADYTHFLEERGARHLWDSAVGYLERWRGGAALARPVPPEGLNDG